MSVANVDVDTKYIHFYCIHKGTIKAQLTSDISIHFGSSMKSSPRISKNTRAELEQRLRTML